MAVPKRRVTISRKKQRNLNTKKNIKNNKYNYAICTTCHYVKKKHNICINCK